MHPSITDFSPIPVGTSHTSALSQSDTGWVTVTKSEVEMSEPMRTLYRPHTDVFSIYCLNKVRLVFSDMNRNLGSVAFPGLLVRKLLVSGDEQNRI